MVYEFLHSCYVHNVHNAWVETEYIWQTKPSEGNEGLSLSLVWTIYTQSLPVCVTVQKTLYVQTIMVVTAAYANLAIEEMEVFVKV